MEAKSMRGYKNRHPVSESLKPPDGENSSRCHAKRPKGTVALHGPEYGDAERKDGRRAG